MKRINRSFFNSIGGVSFLAGTAIATSFISLTRLTTLRGGGVIPFLSYFFIAAGAYLLVLFRLKRDRITTRSIWGFAILFRLILLFTSPTLSDDVYRYIWDGHLLNQGISPYALPVSSPALDSFNIPTRDLVNHDWMASPYLPAAQFYFAIVTRIAPVSEIAFQVGAIILDIAVGLMLQKLLRNLQIPVQGVLIYLWNPLVLIEFAHSAHVDVLMLFFTLLAFTFLLSKPDGADQNKLSVYASALSLAAATLTKGVPILLVPLFIRRWGWKGLAVFGTAVLGSLLLFVPGAGWGVSGPLDGTGIFGALRIYTTYWNFNSGIYHWVETWLSGYKTPGAVPLEIAGEGLIRIIRWLTVGITLIISVLAGWFAWKRGIKKEPNMLPETLILLRLSLLPLGIFLLLSPTLHPWYVTITLLFLPFLLTMQGEDGPSPRFLWSWITLTLTVPFSYLTYIDLQNFREFTLVRWLEYLPFYLLFAWAVIMSIRYDVFKRRI